MSRSPLWFRLLCWPCATVVWFINYCWLKRRRNALAIECEQIFVLLSCWLSSFSPLCSAVRSISSSIFSCNYHLVWTRTLFNVSTPSPIFSLRSMDSSISFSSLLSVNVSERWFSTSSFVTGNIHSVHPWTATAPIGEGLPLLSMLSVDSRETVRWRTQIYGQPSPVDVRQQRWLFSTIHRKRERHWVARWIRIHRVWTFHRWTKVRRMYWPNWLKHLFSIHPTRHWILSFQSTTVERTFRPLLTECHLPEIIQRLLLTCVCLSVYLFLLTKYIIDGDFSSQPNTKNTHARANWSLWSFP